MELYIAVFVVVISIFIYNLVSDHLSPCLARRVSVISKRSVNTTTRFGVVVKSHFRITFQLLDDSYGVFTVRGREKSSLAKAYSSLEVGCKGILYTRRDEFVGMSKIQEY